MSARFWVRWGKSDGVVGEYRNVPEEHLQGLVSQAWRIEDVAYVEMDVEPTEVSEY